MEGREEEDECGDVLHRGGWGARGAQGVREGRFDGERDDSNSRRVGDLKQIKDYCLM